MAKFLARRLLSIFISLIGATIFIFVLTRLGPDPLTLYIGDAQVELSEEQIQLIKEQLGLDKNLPMQYLTWVWNLIQFDMGQSIGTLRPVSEIIRIHIAVTLILAGGAWIFAITVGISMGILAAIKRATFWDYAGRAFALMGQATPQFWSGVLAIFFFAVLLREWIGLDFFPTGGIGEYDGFPLHWGNVKYYILPWIVLGWPASASIMRLTRSSMLEILDSEFIKLARAKGVSPITIIWKHGLRNAIIPPLTSALVLLADYLNGALVVEIIFSLPGIGTVALNQAVYDNDWPLLAGTVFVFLGIYVTFAFLADISLRADRPSHTVRVTMLSNPTNMTDLERDLMGLRRYPPVLQQLNITWRFIRRWPVIPMFILAVLIFCGIFAPALSTHGEAAGGIRDRHYPPIWMQDDRYDKLRAEGETPFNCLWTAVLGNPENTRRADVCNFHIFGTDHSGRDVYSRMMHGARISLWVAAIALIFGFVVGTSMGVNGGYAGGWIDEIITRAVDIWQALPFLMVALVCVLIFGQSTVLLLALMAALSWVPFVRVIRGQTLTIKNQAFVDLARVAGCSTPRILIRHIVPGVINTAVVIATLIVGSLILAEAALSFLGAGVPAPDATWGSMVSEGRGYISTAWWPTILPGLAIFMVVMSLNFTGDWLRDRLDPRLQQIG